MREVAKRSCLTQIRSASFDPDYVSSEVTNTGYKASIGVDDISAQKGEIVSLPIRISDNKGLKSIELLVYCDTEDIILEEVKEGSVIDGWGVFGIQYFSNGENQ